MTKHADKIIVALDVSSKAESLALVEHLRDEISLFKVGLQLFTAAGPELVREIIATGAKVFLDLKFHDIPNTVASAVGMAQELGVAMLTIHLSGGAEMIKAAVTARKASLSIIGVTVLTSSNDQTLSEIGVLQQVENQVLRLARLSSAAGVDGLVASAHEIKILREAFGNTLKIIVPGIRPVGTHMADQKRVMTPRAALEAGADYMVIGRPITAEPDPRNALARIIAELS
jgi:orotidine-5'-phosphate decarboxylase